MALPPLSRLLVILLALLVSAGAAGADSITDDGGHHQSQTTRHARIFSFGDSLTDTGNALSILGDRVTISRPPYGETFFGRPSGRASDGRIMIDFLGEHRTLASPGISFHLRRKRTVVEDDIVRCARYGRPCLYMHAAEAMAVPQPTPYLLAGKTAADFRPGVNFAVGGGTALDPAFFEGRGLKVFVPVSLRNQTAWFKNVLQRLGSVHGNSSCLMLASSFHI
jgi:hypothetical protein